MEAELRCSSDTCTRLPLVAPPPRPPRPTPLFFQARSLGANTILIVGSSWMWTEILCMGTSGGLLMGLNVTFFGWRYQ